MALAPDDEILVALLLIGTNGDVKAFLDLFGNLPRFKPTVFTNEEHETFVQKRGFEFVNIFRFSSLADSNPQWSKIMGVEFYRVWTSHLLSDAVLEAYGRGIALLFAVHKTQCGTVYECAPRKIATTSVRELDLLLCASTAVPSAPLPASARRGVT